MTRRPPPVEDDSRFLYKQTFVPRTKGPEQPTPIATPLQTWLRVVLTLYQKDEPASDGAVHARGGNSAIARCSSGGTKRTKRSEGDLQGCTRKTSRTKKTRPIVASFVQNRELTERLHSLLSSFQIFRWTCIGIRGPNKTNKALYISTDTV